MPADEKTSQLIDELVKATRAGKIRWIPTALLGEFTASFRGKFSVVIREMQLSMTDQINRQLTGLLEPEPELRLLDDSGSLLLRVEGPPVRPLLDLARGPSADRAIDEIVEELKAR